MLAPHLASGVLKWRYVEYSARGDWNYYLKSEAVVAGILLDVCR